MISFATSNLNLYYINAAMCLAVAFGLGFAISFDRKHIRRAWKPVLIFLTIEQGVLAYSAIEAMKSHVAVEFRQVLFAVTIFCVLLSVIFVLVAIRKPGSWWFYRDQNDPSSSPRH